MIQFNSISKQYGSSVLLEDSEFSFNEKDRIGLIGANGSGKTTLLRMLVSIEQQDKGSIQVPSGFKIDYLPQEVETFDGSTPIEIILKPFAHLLNFEETLASIADDIAHHDHKALHEIEKLQAQMEYHDGFSLQSRAEAILDGLGIPQEQWSRPVQELSGGYRMRAVLGRLLLTSPDMMLLDEPTNHLDMDSLIWLERFLCRYKGGLLIVSHDRDFLNRITTCTAEISNHKVTVHKGNYDAFQEYKAVTEEQALNTTRNIEAQIAHAERFVERFKAKSTKATQAQSRMKMIEELKSRLPMIESKNETIRFTLPVPQPSGSVPVKVDAVHFSYDQKDVFKGISLSVNRGEKVAIIGPNGAGKSTLLKLCAGLITPSEGTIVPGHNTTIRYFGQHQMEQLDLEKTVYDTVAATSVNTEKTYIRNVLGTFLFSGDSIDKKVRVLSGGEKSRLVLATILASPGNLLLLDEPTNHLDINSIDVLANAMTQYTGTIMFVSHDDFFIRKIATRIIEVRPGMVRDFPGAMDDYRWYCEQGLGIEEQAQSSSASAKPESEEDEKAARIQERERKKKLTRTIEKVEREISQHETDVQRLQAILDNPANGSNHTLLSSTAIDLEKARTAAESAVTEWERLSLELDSAYLGTD